PAALLLAAYAVVRSRRMEFVQGFGMVIAAGVTCGYHVAWYDGAVLVIPFGFALKQGGRLLQTVTIVLMLVPLWDFLSPFVSALLLAFVILYAVSMVPRGANQQ